MAALLCLLLAFQGCTGKPAQKAAGGEGKVGTYRFIFIGDDLNDTGVVDVTAGDLSSSAGEAIDWHAAETANSSGMPPPPPEDLPGS